ncbi:MAG: hypothetical protein HOO96_15755 [Polyangiaceae bacterium]|nr:hypothetical protein [Polyangiaceae bacterium]
MGLYLCIFDEDEEVFGVEVGFYADFAHLRDAVARSLEDGDLGDRFPVLMLHSDCDGEWSPHDAARLAVELDEIERAFTELPPRPLESEWKLQVAKSLGLRPANLGECFFDIDGEPLLLRLKALCKISVEWSLPILFQ